MAGPSFKGLFLAVAVDFKIHTGSRLLPEWRGSEVALPFGRESLGTNDPNQ